MGDKTNLSADFYLIPKYMDDLEFFTTLQRLNGDVQSGPSVAIKFQSCLAPSKSLKNKL